MAHQKSLGRLVAVRWCVLCVATRCANSNRELESSALRLASKEQKAERSQSLLASLISQRRGRGRDVPGMSFVRIRFVRVVCVCDVGVVFRRPGRRQLDERFDRQTKRERYG